MFVEGFGPCFSACTSAEMLELDICMENFAVGQTSTEKVYALWCLLRTHKYLLDLDSTYVLACEPWALAQQQRLW